MTPTLGEEGGVVKGNTDKPGTVVHGSVQVSFYLFLFLLYPSLKYDLELLSGDTLA